MMECDNIVMTKNIGPMNFNPLENFGAIANRVKEDVQTMK
jgi:hypothetical protein